MDRTQKINTLSCCATHIFEDDTKPKNWANVCSSEESVSCFRSSVLKKFQDRKRNR